MIFANHDFTHNYLSAVGYEDEMAVKQMIIDELAKLIVDDKKDVVKLLRGEGVNVSYGDNNLTVSRFLTTEIKKGNQKVINQVSDMIANNSIDDEGAKTVLNSFLGADAKRTGKLKGLFKKEELFTKLKTLAKDEKVKEGVSSLIAMQLQKTYNKKNTQSASNQAQLDQRLVINEAKSKTSRSSKKGRKKGLKIGLIVGGSAILAAAAFLIIRKSMSSGESTVE